MNKNNTQQALELTQENKELMVQLEAAKLELEKLDNPGKEKKSVRERLNSLKADYPNLIESTKTGLKGAIPVALLSIGLTALGAAAIRGMDEEELAEFKQLMND